jgi:hypothetical protein
MTSLLKTDERLPSLFPKVFDPVSIEHLRPSSPMAWLASQMISKVTLAPSNDQASSSSLLSLPTIIEEEIPKEVIPDLPLEEGDDEPVLFSNIPQISVEVPKVDEEEPVFLTPLRRTQSDFGIQVGLFASKKEQALKNDNVTDLDLLSPQLLLQNKLLHRRRSNSAFEPSTLPPSPSRSKTNSSHTEVLDSVPLGTPPEPQSLPVTKVQGDLKYVSAATVSHFEIQWELILV